MLSSLACWIILTFPLGSIQPEPVYCLSTNKSHMILKELEVAQYRRKRELAEPWQNNFLEPIRDDEPGRLDEDWADSLPVDEEDDFPSLVRIKRKIPKQARGMTPYKINDQYINYDPEKMSNWVSPSFSNLVFRKDDVGKVTAKP